MRKSIIICCLLCLLLTGCSKIQKEITCADIVAAYEAAGYEVFHKDPSGIDDYECYIVIENEAGDTIYFHRFLTAIEAQSYAEAQQYHVLIWLFSVIYGDPMWVHTTTYGCYEIEYTSSELYEIFAELIR